MTGQVLRLDTSLFAAQVDRALPPRLTTDQVCALSGFSSVSLWRRMKDGRMPRPIDRGRQSLFDRDAILVALRLSNPLMEAQNTPRGMEILSDAQAKRRLKSQSAP